MTKESTLSAQAFSLCKKCFEDGDLEMARVYCMNAISHENVLQYFEALAAIVCKLPKAEQAEAIEQTINILQMALFQVDAEDVATLKKILDTLEVQFASFSPSADDNGSNNPETDNAISVLSKVLSGSLSWKTLRIKGGIEDINAVRIRVQQLQQIVSGGNLDARSSEVCARELQESTAYLNFLEQYSIVELHGQQIETELAEKHQSFYYIAARIQNISALLNQMWLCDIPGILPKAQFEGIMEKLTERSKRFESKYLHLRDVPVLDEIHNIVDKALQKISVAQKITPCILNLEKSLQSISSKAAEIADPECADKIREELEKIKAKIFELSQKRYAAYQKMAAEHSVNAILDYDNTRLVTENDAMTFLQKNQLAKIDEALLSPEASGLFHSAKQILTAKLSSHHNANFQMECVTTNKFKLEDF